VISEAVNTLAEIFFGCVHVISTSKTKTGTHATLRRPQSMADKNEVSSQYFRRVNAAFTYFQGFLPRFAVLCITISDGLELHLRSLLSATLALTLLLPITKVPAIEPNLPDIGSSAGELLTPARQAEYGGMMLRELRNQGYLLDDPLIDEWLQTLGQRLGANSAQPQQPFTFFMLRDQQINAFATLGGYIGVNAGLILETQREDEAAAVLSHEIAHVTQQHVLRSVERAQRDQLPILMGMLAAVVAAQQAGGTSGSNATMAGIVGGMGLMQQRQINYTRSNESEADRLGIRTLARSGYDVTAMAGFFERLAASSRSNEGDGSAPEYLRTHPVTVTRISEAKARAEQIGREVPIEPAPGQRADRRNLLLPSQIDIDRALSGPARGKSGHFDWAQERIRALTAPTTAALIQHYQQLHRSQPGGLNDAQRYGQIIARLRDGGKAEATDIQYLRTLQAAHLDNLWIRIALAQALSRNGNPEAANSQFEALLQRRPNNRAIALTWAQTLNEQGTAAAGRQAQSMLRPLLNSAADDPEFQRQFARACELAGDTARASEAHADLAWLNGRPEQALSQFQALLQREDIDYVSRARINARIEAIMPLILELRRVGRVQLQAQLQEAMTHSAIHAHLHDHEAHSSP